MLISLFIQTDLAGGGWVVYSSVSGIRTSNPGSGLGYDFMACVAMTFFIASSLLGGITYIHYSNPLKTKGMSFSSVAMDDLAFFLTR